LGALQAVSPTVEIAALATNRKKRRVNISGVMEILIAGLVDILSR
jgi:hypothetical protein